MTSTTDTQQDIHYKKKKKGGTLCSLTILLFKGLWDCGQQEFDSWHSKEVKLVSIECKCVVQIMGTDYIIIAQIVYVLFFCILHTAKMILGVMLYFIVYVQNPNSTWAIFCLQPYSSLVLSGGSLNSNFVKALATKLCCSNNPVSI